METTTKSLPNHFNNSYDNDQITAKSLYNYQKQIIDTSTKDNHQNTQNPNQNKRKVEHIFNTNNTYLHALFGQERAEKILDILYRKTTQITLCLSIIILFLALNIFGATWGYSLASVFVVLLHTPYMMIWSLSANRKALRLTMNSFEMWFKITYGILCGILQFILWYKVWRIKYDNNDTLSAWTWQISYDLFTGHLLTFCVSSFDAMNISKGWKTSISALVACWYLWLSINFQFLWSQEDDYIVYISTTDSTVSFYSMIGSILRMLAIFFLKQSFLSYIRNEKCVTITHTPYIKWVDGENKTEGMNMSDDEQETNQKLNEDNKINVGEIAIDHKKLEDDDMSVSFRFHDIEESTKL
eukprot:218467_1